VPHKAQLRFTIRGMARNNDSNGLPPAPDLAPDSETTSLQLQLADLHDLLVELLEHRKTGDPFRKKPPVSEVYLTRSELIRVLKVSLSTLDRLVGDGMPFTWVGRHRLFELEKVRCWLDRA